MLSGALFGGRAGRLGAILAAVAPIVVSVALDRALPPVRGEARAPVIRLVQPNAPQSQKWNPDKVLGFYRRGLSLTAAPVAEGDRRPAMVIWPETSLPWLLAEAQPALDQISAAAGGVPVVVGAMRRDGKGLFNSLVVLDGTGAVAAVYDKHHLVPFGEYTPLLPEIAAFGWGGDFGTGFAAGPGPRLLDAGPGGPFLPLICYEVIFPDQVRAAPARPKWLLQITNDAWFGNFAGPYQHLDQARMRAIETGLPLLRAANTGVSAVIGPRGHVLASLPLGVTGHLDAPLPPALAPTPYWRWGDGPVLALIAALAAFMLFQRGRNRH